MKLVTFDRDDGSQVLVTTYDSGEVTLAERPNVHATWGPPLTGAVETYDYKASEAADFTGLIWGERA